MQSSPPESEKVTIPVGVPPSSGVTVAESMICWPTTAGLADDDGVDVSVVPIGSAPAGVDDNASATGVRTIPAITARATLPFTSRGARARRASDLITIYSFSPGSPTCRIGCFLPRTRDAESSHQSFIWRSRRCHHLFALATWAPRRRRVRRGAGAEDRRRGPGSADTRTEDREPRNALRQSPETVRYRPRGRWQEPQCPARTTFEHGAETGQHQRERDDDGHHLEDGTAHRLPIADVVELVEAVLAPIGPTGFPGWPVFERAWLTGRQIAHERSQACGEVGLRRSRDVTLHPANVSPAHRQRDG